MTKTKLDANKVQALTDEVLRKIIFLLLAAMLLTMMR